MRKTLAERQDAMKKRWNERTSHEPYVPYRPQKATEMNDSYERQKVPVKKDPNGGTLTITVPENSSECAFLRSFLQVRDACMNRQSFYTGHCFTGAPNGVLGIVSAIVTLDDSLAPELKARLDKTVDEFCKEHGMEHVDPPGDELAHLRRVAKFQNAEGEQYGINQGWLHP